MATMTPESIEWLLNRAALAYEAESKATEKIRERVNFIFSVAIAPCVAIAAYLVNSLRGDPWTCASISFFWVPLGVSMLLLLIAIFLIGYVLVGGFKVGGFKVGGFKYATVPLPSTIIKYFEEHPAPESALLHGQFGLLKEYAESTDHNRTQNVHRTTRLLRAQKLSFFSLLLLVIFCMPRWTYNWTQNEVQPQAVKIINPVQIIKEK